MVSAFQFCWKHLSTKIIKQLFPKLIGVHAWVHKKRQGKTDRKKLVHCTHEQVNSSTKTFSCTGFDFQGFTYSQLSATASDLPVEQFSMELEDKSRNFNLLRCFRFSTFLILLPANVRNLKDERIYIMLLLQLVTYNQD